MGCWWPHGSEHGRYSGLIDTSHPGFLLAVLVSRITYHAWEEYAGEDRARHPSRILRLSRETAFPGEASITCIVSASIILSRSNTPPDRIRRAPHTAQTSLGIRYQSKSVPCCHHMNLHFCHRVYSNSYILTDARVRLPLCTTYIMMMGHYGVDLIQ
jgi:hypothetical protein